MSSDVCDVRHRVAPATLYQSSENIADEAARYGCSRGPDLGERMPTVSGKEWESSVPHLLWRAQNAVHRSMVEALSGMGVTVTQLGLAVHIEDYGQLSGSDLARRFRITPQSVTTALNQLEALGWVTRRAHPDHGRVILYELTEVGRTSTAAGRTRVAAARAALDEVLGPDADGFAAVLRRLTVALDGADPA
jgi:DNA-binding MarR family transcriptional regulator